MCFHKHTRRSRTRAAFSFSKSIAATKSVHSAALAFVLPFFFSIPFIIFALFVFIFPSLNVTQTEGH